MRSFLKELRRRRVFRTAALYVVGAWLVMQAADVLFPAWGIPDVAINYLLAAAVAGFPLALGLGWLFDVGYGGIRRTKPADANELSAALPLRGSDYLILSAFIAVAGVILYNTVVSVVDAPLEPKVITPTAEKIENSIAVLPFTNMSSDPENEYFANGISEEILNRLGEFRDLHVIARTSSFAFEDSGYDIPRLSDLLRVRFLLQGSVRKDSNQVRISAQLVDASGQQVWSNSYDRELKGIFEIQRDVAETVASSIAPHLSNKRLDESPKNIEAYQHYLVGREILHKRAGLWTDLARAQFERAIEIDPQYAEPYAELAILSAYDKIYGLGFGDDPEKQLEQAQQAIDTALSLKPDLARAYAAQGLLGHVRDEYPQSEAPLRRAVALDPNMTDANNWLAGTLSALGRKAEAHAVTEHAARIDPLAIPLNLNLAMHYAEQGDFARAERGLRRLIRVPQPAWVTFSVLSEFYSATGRIVDLHDIGKQRALSLAESTGRPVTDRLALSYASLGMWEQAEYWHKRSADAWPEWYWWSLRRSDLLMRRGRFREMVEMYQSTFESRDLDVATLSPQLISQFATAKALAGDYADAVRIFESGLDLEKPVSSIGFEEIDGRQTLAWIYLDFEANEKGQQMLDAVERTYEQMRVDGWLHLSIDLMLFAQNALIAGDHDLTLARFKEAIDAGWRDYYTLAHDPRWDPVRDDSRFKDLMATVKADLDAQRVRVEQIDAEDDFVARFDHVLAAAQQSQPQNTSTN